MVAVGRRPNTTLPLLQVAPPVTMWEREEVAIDVWHHLVYAVATGLTYELLNRRASA